MMICVDGIERQIQHGGKSKFLLKFIYFVRKISDYETGCLKTE